MGLLVSIVGGEGRMDWGMIRPEGGGDGVERARYLLGSKVIMLFLWFGAEVQFALWFNVNVTNSWKFGSTVIDHSPQEARFMLGKLRFWTWNQSQKCRRCWIPFCETGCRIGAWIFSHVQEKNPEWRVITETLERCFFLFSPVQPHVWLNTLNLLHNAVYSVQELPN